MQDQGLHGAQLWQFFKDEGEPLDEISQKTGYAMGYLLNIFEGRSPLTDKAKFRFLRAYPTLAEMLLGAQEAA